MPKKKKKTSAAQHLMDHCRGLAGATEDVKWEHNLVFSVGKKMFALFNLPDGPPLSFKVEPDLFQILTQQDPFEPAPYLAKHHWVAVSDPDALPIEMLEELTSDSHQLVAAKLSQKLQRSLGLLA